MSNVNIAQLQAMLRQAQQSDIKPLLEFSAGMCNLSGTTVTADNRRGKVIVKHGDDGLLRLYWHLRPSNNKVLDVVLFPRGPNWEHVPECKDGRVYLLRFPSTNRKLFFWLQEVDEKKDEEIAKTMKDLIANPPPAPEGQDLMGMLNQGGSSGSGSGAATSASAARTTNSGSGSGASSNSSARAAAAAPMPRPTSLHSVLNPGRGVPVIESMLADEKDAKELDALLEYLPGGLQSRDELKHALRTPALQQTLRRFDGLLQSAQFMSIMQSFGLRVTGDLGVDAFLAAIAEQAREEKSKENN